MLSGSRLGRFKVPAHHSRCNCLNVIYDTVGDAYIRPGYRTVVVFNNFWEQTQERRC